MEGSCTAVYEQLRMLGIGDWQIVISTNIGLRRDGLPFSNQKNPDDPGAAVFFKLDDKPVSMACDKWRRVEDNVYAIAQHIEAMRGQLRWGVGSVEQAFRGYTALPAPGESGLPTWYSILGIAHNAPFEVAAVAYKEKARVSHPDNGGSHDEMVRLNGAWDQAREAYGKK